MQTELLGYPTWLCFRILFLALLVLYLFFGLDDLIIDATYYVRSLVRTLLRRHQIRPVTAEELAATPEQPIALLVPAWHESNVIGPMLRKTCSHLLYRDYHIFVGTYPNDEATRLEVDKVREVFPNIHVVVNPAEGPTNKADCLNWICQGIAAFEKTHGITFRIYVFHDAEDVVHPLSLRWYNHLIPRVHFIQIPVFPLERGWQHFTAGLYGDEFAEAHTKDLRAREVLAASVPSAGVGTAISREAMQYLAQKRNDQVFDITSLTEDYMMGLLLRDMPGRKIFLQQEYLRTVERRNPVTGHIHKRHVRDWIATREFFPDTLRTSVRQRSRWVLGISLQGWKAGWTRHLGLNYCLYRDRKSVVTNLLVVAGYFAVFYWAVQHLAARLYPEFAGTPLLTRGDPFFPLLYAAGGLFAWRMLNRFLAVRRIYGWGHAFLSIPRFFWGNVINFCASWVAIRRYVEARRSGKVPEWGKTEHAYPTEAQLVHFRRKLGDLLLEQRAINTAQLRAAMERQQRTGGKLGDILIQMGALWEEDLVNALAAQEHVQAVELDPARTPPDLLKRLPADLARTYRVFPVRAIESGLELATDDERRDLLQPRLEALLAMRVQLVPTSRADIDFALDRAYGTGAAPPVDLQTERLGERLVRKGLVSKEELQTALRRQKRSRRTLGEILQEMNPTLAGELAKEVRL